MDFSSLHVEANDLSFETDSLTMGSLQTERLTTYTRRIMQTVNNGSFNLSFPILVICTPPHPPCYTVGIFGRMLKLVVTEDTLVFFASFSEKTFGVSLLGADVSYGASFVITCYQTKVSSYFSFAKYVCVVID